MMGRPERHPTLDRDGDMDRDMRNRHIGNNTDEQTTVNTVKHTEMSWQTYIDLQIRTLTDRKHFDFNMNQTDLQTQETQQQKIGWSETQPDSYLLGDV